jgi:hypothetical protein
LVALVLLLVPWLPAKAPMTFRGQVPLPAGQERKRRQELLRNVLLA